MENLSNALASKTLEDLASSVEEVQCVALEPSKAEIEEIVARLLAGDSHKKIKKEVRREVGAGNQGFSYGQIKEIELAMNAKKAELTPCSECDKAPCACTKPELN